MNDVDNVTIGGPYFIGNTIAWLHFQAVFEAQSRVNDYFEKYFHHIWLSICNE